MKYISNPAHPFSKFGSGNLKSLITQTKEKGIDVRDELIKFHKTHYGAGLMRLCVYGKEPLNILEKWVTSKFGEIKEGPAGFEDIYLPPKTDIAKAFTKQYQLGKKIYVNPVKDLRSLKLIFPSPPQR